MFFTIAFLTFAANAQDFEWVKTIGGVWSDDAFSTTIDASGNIYNTGYFADTVDFDPGVGIHTLISEGISDVYVQKLDSSGNFVWAKSFGGVNYDMAFSITVDASGNV